MDINSENLIIRPLEKKDREQIRILDEESDNTVWIFYVEEKRFGKESDAIGLFLENQLIAYLSINTVFHEIDNILRYLHLDRDSLYYNYNNDFRHIEDIYVLEDYRGCGFGTKLIKEVLSKENLPVFLLAGGDELISYYEKLGFEHIGNCSMVYFPKS